MRSMAGWSDVLPVIIDDPAPRRTTSAGAGRRLRRHEPQELQGRVQGHRQRLPHRPPSARDRPEPHPQREDLTNIGPSRFSRTLR
jgi:hypothetical protein